MAFNIGFSAYAIIGHTWADQLLPQLLMEQFDTFPIQCRHIEHMHEGVWFRKNNFYQNDSCENIDNFSLIGLLYMHSMFKPMDKKIIVIIPPANFVCRGYKYCFHVVGPSLRASVRYARQIF